MTQAPVTKTTENLVPGDQVVYQTATTDKGLLLPLSAEHPGEVITVLDVRPWMLTAGPYAGQQARDGRRNTGAALFEVVISDTDTKRIAGRPVAQADREWLLA